LNHNGQPSSGWPFFLFIPCSNVQNFPKFICNSAFVCRDCVRVPHRGLRLGVSQSIQILNEQPKDTNATLHSPPHLLVWETAQELHTFVGVSWGEPRSPHAGQTRVVSHARSKRDSRSDTPLDEQGGFYKNRKQPVSAPIDRVPPEMPDIHLQLIKGGECYALTFRKPASGEEPSRNLAAKTASISCTSGITVD
jgi:hypothetical protein